jgi:nicotinamidase-related amidase
MNSKARTNRGSTKSKIRYQPGDALIIIDVINDLSFPGGEKVLPWADKLSSRLASFLKHARRQDLPVIYVNDNFGNWQSNFLEVYAHCTRKTARGRAIVRRLKPTAKDYFILKPRHSGFFATSLLPLLEDLRVKRLILCGIATNLCVLFTAHDAHMHRYPLVVLSDCCAAESDFDHNVALTQLQRFCGAKVCRSDEYNFISTHRRKRSRD